MNIKLYIRSSEGERACVGSGDPAEFVRLLQDFGVEGEFPDWELQWFDEGTGRAGLEAIYAAPGDES